MGKRDEVECAPTHVRQAARAGMRICSKTPPRRALRTAKHETFHLVYSLAVSFVLNNVTGLWSVAEHERHHVGVGDRFSGIPEPAQRTHFGACVNEGVEPRVLE